MDESASTLYASLSNRWLHLILMPTEACNFRCTYCYEDFAQGRMRPHVVAGVKRFIARRADELELLTLSWFGGEPLLAFDLVEELLEHVRTVQRAHPGMRLASDMTTNAYRLTPEAFTRLLDLGVTRYQVSFDGPRRAHDRTRRLASGGGTFDRIWDNVRAMRAEQRPFDVLIRLHATRGNQAELPEFIAAYEQEFGADRRFKLFLRAVTPLGGPNDASFPFLGQDARPAIAALGRCADEHRVEHLTAEHLQPVCYAARGNSFLVRADGRLNKCTVALDHPANQVGTIDAEGSVVLADERMRTWMRGLWSGDEEILECPMRGLAEPEAPFPRVNFTARAAARSER